jgi:hypothetical protein
MGFAVAGFYFGTFSHVFNHSTASGTSNAPYGVVYLGEYATYAGLLPNANFTNSSGAGPCQVGTANGTNVLNNTSAQAGSATGGPLNLASSNATNSVNASTTYICLDWVNNGAIGYQWDNGTLANATNYTAWDTISASANNTTNGNATFMTNLSALTGNPALANSTLNMTGCNPVGNNSTILSLSHCRFFAGNNQTEFIPHAGFYNSTGAWINETNATGPDPAYWAPNETGYAPADSVYQATVFFTNATQSNTTYEVVIYMAGATPIPMVYFVNSGVVPAWGETLTFVFDMTLAWNTELPGGSYGATNSTDGFYSGIIAEVASVSITTYQCYIDASGTTACPGANALESALGNILA